MIKIKGILSGLKTLKQESERSNSGGGGSSFLKLKDKESVRVRFLQELDESAKNYDKNHGVAHAYLEHTNPDSGNPRFICTLEEEGQCLGCELATKDPKWKKRPRLYINAMVRRDDGDEVLIVNQGLSSKSIGAALIEFAEENGTICDRDFKIKRNGELLQTTYLLMPTDSSPLTAEEKKADLIDVNRFVKQLTYEEQVEALNGAGSKSTGDKW